MSLRPLSAALEGWSPARGIAPEPLHAIAAAWPAIVGADVAAHCGPLEIAGGTLVITTRSSAWSQQLQFLSLRILEGVRAVAAGATVERLSFRVGVPRRGERPASVSAPRASAKRHFRESVSAPAVDLAEALERLRRRIRALRRTASVVCSGCGAPLDGGPVALCAPCAGEAQGSQRTELQRLLYMAPWLSPEELRAQLPRVTAGEIDAARRYLLQRWWLVLERARRAGRTSATRLERQVASSYVLLQSKLPPDRITPAIVRNLLGPELEALLWPERSK